MSAAGVEFVDAAVRSALGRSRVAAADAYYKESHHRRWLVSSGDTVRTAAQESGFAVRLFRGDGRVGHGSASGCGTGIQLDTVLEAAGRAEKNTGEVPEDARSFSLVFVDAAGTIDCHLPQAT